MPEKWGWRGCENVAWPVTRVHAGKLFLFICSVLPWRIDISHEFTWKKRRKEEGHPSFPSSSLLPSSVDGDGERFPFPLLAERWLLSYVSCFSLHRATPAASRQSKSPICRLNFRDNGFALLCHACGLLVGLLEILLKVDRVEISHWKFLVFEEKSRTQELI